MVKKADTKTAPEAGEKSGGKIKIKLLCDVLTSDGKLKEGETLEVTQEQLDTFADSFYERV